MLTQDMIFMDFGIISKEKNKSLFSGRQNGCEYAQDYNLTSFDNRPLLHFIVPENIVIAGSFYLGLLEKYFQLFTNKEECYKYITYNSEYYEKNKVPELERGMDRAFRLNVTSDYLK